MHEKCPFLAYLGLGSNVGEKHTYLSDALSLLEKEGDITVFKRSHIYKTAPWGYQKQDWFLNAVVSVKTSLDPFMLLDRCLEIEQMLGRIREIRWGPRTLDLDILDYQQETINSERLVLPHPLAHQRGFVLIPLCEIAPELVFQGMTAEKWLQRLPVEETETIIIQPEFIL